MTELDRKRPYAVVTGIGEAHKYEQDGKKFDGMGKEICPVQKPSGPPVDGAEGSWVPIENRMLIVDKNANGYLSIKELKSALEAVGVSVSPKNNNRTSLLEQLKAYKGIN